jgi:succinate dehydrogenase cytochrome b556 subunit
MATMRTQALDTARGGMWPWLGQRVTAVVVIVTIGIHLVLTHYIAIGELSFDDIASRLAGGAVLVNDVVLLVAVVFHALNGVRMVLLDYWFTGSGARHALAAVLWVVGAAAVVFGIWALWVWVS